jgi:succinyl-CoA synthetase beta subunit
VALGEDLVAIEVNPLPVTADGAAALDATVQRRPRS